MESNSSQWSHQSAICFPRFCNAARRSGNQFWFAISTKSSVPAGLLPSPGDPSFHSAQTLIHAFVSGHQDYQHEQNNEHLTRPGLFRSNCRASFWFRRTLNFSFTSRYPFFFFFLDFHMMFHLHLTFPEQVTVIYHKIQS